jgi:hypothetical protein
MSFLIGESVTLEEIKASFSRQINFISDEKILITAFIEFQYGSLNPSNKVHKSILDKVNKLANAHDLKGLTRSLIGSKEKEEEKEEDNAKEKEEDSAKSEIQKAESFNTILNPTQLQNAALIRSKEIANFEEKLFHPLAFGSSLPVGFSKMKKNFLATLVEVYEGSEADFCSHLNAIIAEEGVKEREGVARTDYLFTRIKNKALELHNAKQS